MSEPTPVEVPSETPAPEPLALELMLPPLPDDPLPVLNQLLDENQRLRNRLKGGYVVVCLLGLVSAIQLAGTWTTCKVLHDLRQETAEPKRRADEAVVRAEQAFTETQEIAADFLIAGRNFRADAYEYRQMKPTVEAAAKLESQVKELKALVRGLREELREVLENEQIMQLAQTHYHKNEPPKCPVARPKDPAERRKVDEDE